MSERSSKLVVKETSQVNTSSRIYYYGGASVPFLWETRPGTPKHPLYSESFRLPPLTPPPSYYSSSENKLSNKVRTKQTRFVKTLKHHVSRSWSSTTSSSSSSSSSSFSSSSSPRSKTVPRANKCYKLSCSRSCVKDDEEEESGSLSPRSTLCYKRGFSVKRALCSILSHKSTRNDLRLV